MTSLQQSSSYSSQRPAKKRAHHHHDSIPMRRSSYYYSKKASSDLMTSLSSSLHQILLHQPTTTAAPLSEWLNDALVKVGVSSNVAALKLWSEYGRENDEQFCNVRYLLWVCQHVLFDDTVTTAASSSSSSLDVLQSWQQSMETLIIQTENDENEMGVMWQMLLHNLHLTPQQLQLAYRQYTNPRIRNNTNIDDISYCFMWPSFFKTVVDEASGLQSNIRNTIDDGRVHKRQKSHHGKYNNNLLFSSSSSTTTHQSNLVNTAWWPLLGYSITHAILSSNSNDNHNNSDPSTTIQQKLQTVQTDIIQSLPSLMGIPCFDYVKKHSLLSGVVACVLDVLGEGLVLGSLSLEEMEEQGGGKVKKDGGGGGKKVRMMVGEGGDNNYLGTTYPDIMDVEVDQIVDLLLLCSGALSSLAKRVNTPIANLVSEAAEMILNFSEVHHRLQQIKSGGDGGDDDNIDNDNTTTTTTTTQLIQQDATKVVQFIAKANPQLAKEYSNRAFIPNHYFSTEVASNYSELPPMHPIVVDIRARLLSGTTTEVAKICRHLEECSGLPKPVQQHSWMLLLEKMHVGGTLIEDGSPPSTTDNNDGSGEKVLTLGNIVVGSIGQSCVLEYLANVVLEARETLNPNQRGTLQAKEELRCLKDAVRRTCLKFLVTRAYSPDVALTISNKISDAGTIPHLEDKSMGHTAVEEAIRILSTKSLYEEYNESLDTYEEEEEEEVVVASYAAAASNEEEEEVLREDGPIDMSVDQIGTPFVTRKSAEDDNDELSSPDKDDAQSPFKSPESLQKLKRWQQIQSSTKKHQHLRKSKPASSFSPESAANLEDVGEKEYEEKEEEEDVAEVHDLESSREIAVDEGEEIDENQKEVDESAVDNEYGEQEAAEEDAIDENECDSDATKSIQSNGDNDALDEEDVEEEEEPEDMTYPRHYHEYPGNYSESDDYEQEDEEEANRHVAFHEPGGDASVGDSSNVGSPEVVDLLDDSTESDEDEVAEAIVDEDIASSEEERDEGEVLNESVEKYLAAHPCNDLEMADDEHDTEDDKYSLTEASQQGETFEEGVVYQHESPRMNQSGNADDTHVPENQQPSVLVAAAMSSQRQSAASNMPLQREPLQREPSAGNLSFDNTSAALASVDDNLSEYYDEKSRGENDDYESNVQVTARHHGQDMAIDSVLNDHADSIDSGDEADEKNTETGQGLMTDDGYDAEVSEVEQTNIDKMTRSKAADDDGYLPDAEVSEVEQTKTKKPKTTIEDEGYVPDGGHTTGGEEASEVEQGDYSNKKNKRDVRFEVEANLETTIAPSESVEPATNLSIDDGYLPTDDGMTEEEKGPTAKSLALPAPSIDEGYFPDSGAITEEERLEKERKRRRYMDAEDEGYVPEGHMTAGEGEATDASQVGPDDVAKSPAKSLSSRDENSIEMKDPPKAQPSDERLKDMIDDGYLPSAVEGEGTEEEERSEGEGADITRENISSRARTEPSHSSQKEEALASVLVATATVLQQGGSEAGDIAQRASLPMKDAGNDSESYSSEGVMSEERSVKEEPSEEFSPAMKLPSTPNAPVVPVERAVELLKDDTATNSNEASDGDIEAEQESEDGNEAMDAERAVMPPEEAVAAISENLPESGDEKEDADKEEVELYEGGTFVRSEEADDVHEEGKEERTADTSTNPLESENEEDMEAEDDDSIGSLTVVKLKEQCRQRGLKVSGLKAEIVQRIKDYDAAAAGKPVETASTAKSEPQKKRGRGRPRKQAAGPSSKSSSTRRSARAKKPASKGAIDTPISALTHHSDSELSDDETKSIESETESMARRSRRIIAGQKSIPKAIVTRGKKGPTLPAVPEGETLGEETSKPAALPTRRSTRASNSVTSSRRSTRSANESVASRVSRRSTKGKSKRYD